MIVVIVDDSLDVQKSLARLLGSIAGVSVTGFARDVAGALRLIDAKKPDVVVLDVNLLDGEQGIDVLEYVKREQPDSKVVTVSTATSPKVRETYLAAGASAYFDKATEFMKARDWIAALQPQTNRRNS